MAVQPFTLDDLRRIRDEEKPVMWRGVDLREVGLNVLRETLYLQNDRAGVPGDDISASVPLLRPSNVGVVILNPAYALNYSAAGGDLHELIAGVIGNEGMQEEDLETQLLLTWNAVCKSVPMVRLGRSTADIKPDEFQNVVGDAVKDGNRELGEFPHPGGVLRGHDDTGEKLGVCTSGLTGSEDHGMGELFIGSAFGTVKRLAAAQAEAAPATS